MWNTDTCCMDVSFYVNDIFNTKLQYSNPYMTTINLALMSPGDEISFVFSYFWAEYERITLSYEYLLEQTETISVNSFHKADLLHQNFPNPFTTETQICFELLSSPLFRLMFLIVTDDYSKIWLIVYFFRVCTKYRSIPLAFQRNLYL